ncbi:MAG: hypothetical protein PUI53_05695 [Butyricicoccus porcorum]|nr:hypothetical protein [Butyricicoccus porcorum]
MNYNVKFQTEEKYKSIRYGQGTIYSSACGPASLCNALQVLGIADISIPTMCNLAVSCGARVEGGTDESVLLRSAASKYGFEWRSTSKNAELLSHLKAGGAAILHAGSSYKLFSTSGHFVTAAAASGQTITVLDSYWYSGKYTASSIRRNYVSVVQKGVVKTSLTQCGKATIDRSPSYYLISKLAEPKKEETELVEKTKFEIGGEKFTLDAITKNGTTYVCLKQYNNVLGLDTGYDAATDTRAVNFDQLNIAVNGTEHTVPGLIAGKGHSYASVPDLLKLTGCTVGWNDGSIVVTSSEGDV